MIRAPITSPRASFRTIAVGGTISGCAATADGGAICALSGTSVTINSGAKLQGNSAGGRGGAVYSGATTNLRGGTVGGDPKKSEGNTATGDGGGFYLDSGVTFAMTAGTVTGNETLTGNGGALGAQGSTRISGGKMTGNRANGMDNGKGGAVYAKTTATLTISGSSTAFSENEAREGGALYAECSVTMSRGSMSDNEASVRGGAVVLDGAEAVKDGTPEEGGVRVGGKLLTDGPRFNMTGGTISGNSSGVYVAEGGRLELSGTPSFGTGMGTS